MSMHVIGDRARSRWKHVWFSCFAMFVLGSGAEAGASEASSARQPFTVAESIAWRHVLPFSSEGNRVRRVALFSPDRSRFVLHTRHGDLARNVNVDSLLLFQTRDVERYARSSSGKDAPQPVLLAAIEAAKDEDALTAIQWLDNSKLGFIAMADNGQMQAFAVDASNTVKSTLTSSSTYVVGFATAGERLAYYACVPPTTTDQRPLAVLVDSFEKALPPIVPNASQCYITTPVELFSGAQGAVRKLPLPAMLVYPQLRRIWMAPDGNYAVLVGPAVNAPAHWAEYTGPADDQLAFKPRWVRDDPTSLDLLSRTRYLLADLRTGEITPLLDAPNGQMSLNYTPIEVFWRRDSRSVIVSSTYLPLWDVDPATRARRTKQPAIAEIDIQSRAVTLVAWEPTPSDAQTPQDNPIVDFDWDAAADRLGVIHERATDGAASLETFIRRGASWEKRASNKASSSLLTIEQREGLNERPRIYVTAAGGARAKVLFDPNPQAEQLSFASVRQINWRDGSGLEWKGGLLLPTGYVAGRRYPLIVQTHGFNPHRFLLDGPNDGMAAGTAFAAQALANAGFVVLQVEDNKRTITEDEREGPAVAEGFRSGIDRLVADGVVDAAKVGMITFSRTGYHALHFLSRYPDGLAALAMSDTLQVGYSVHMFNVGNASIVPVLSKLTGGKPTLADMGAWFARNPVYALPRSKAAVRLEGMVQGIGMWELYAVLRDANRPVEFLLYPDGGHVLQKPAERMSSQGGNVDWFRFWLQDYEDPSPKKREQYQRWRTLRAPAVN